MTLRGCRPFLRTDDHQSLGGTTDEDEFTTKPVKFAMGGGLDVVGQTSGGWRDQPDGGNIGNPGGLVGVWAEANTREAIFDALRRRETFGNSGTRMNLSDCSYSTDLGAAELSTTWTDPDFDPALRAFYHVRVLENPTCRWTTYRALERGVAPPAVARGLGGVTMRWTRSRFPCSVRFAAICLPLLLAAACAGTEPAAPAADDAQPATENAAAGPEVERNQLRNAYFGDFHVHSSWSLDAYSLGGNRDDPSLAYRFGRGEEVTKADGTVHRLRAPLDFMAVTDHDTWLGEVHLCEDENDAAYDTPTCEGIRASRWFGSGAFEGRGRRPPDICGQGEATMTAGNKCYERARHLWREIQRNADAFNEPGVFTTFPAYEWTAQPIGYGHLHRNVIFRGDAVPEWGGSAVEMENRPERLWEWLEAACTGDCQVVAIPHNPNLSGGLAFDEFGWTPFTTEMLRLRAWAEPLVEIHQIKGNSECYRGLGTTDEECNFENYYPVCEPGQRQGCANAADFVRNALKTGLRLEADFGVNPFKFGFIASPDDHQSLPGAADEDDFITKPVKFGTGGGLDLIGRARGWDEKADGGNISNPGGLVGVWAEANTRDAIFDALRRRETFGNSGTRIHVRFFAGWDFPADLDTRRDMVEVAYAGGVPMGADLPEPPAGDAGDGPRFVVWAMKDPYSANLQKIQIVKGWAESDGETAEQVYDVVCADGLEPDPRTRRCADNGAQVDLSDCSYPTDLGAAELSTTWTDPDFDAAQRAFYYVRVLENPTCRWTTHRALARGVAPPPSDPPTVKERAWSSPIWYTPAGQ